MPWIIAGALGVLLFQKELGALFGEDQSGSGSGNPLQAIAIEGIIGFGAGKLLKRALKSL